MKKLGLVFCLLVSVLCAEPFNQKCTCENNTFCIKIIELCEEGDIACDKVAYIGLNKKNDEFITLKGRVVVDFKGDFSGYLFENKGYTYSVAFDRVRENYIELTIVKDHKVAQEMRLRNCE